MAVKYACILFLHLLVLPSGARIRNGGLVSGFPQRSHLAEQPGTAPLAHSANSSLQQAQEQGAAAALVSQALSNGEAVSHPIHNFPAGPPVLLAAPTRVSTFAEGPTLNSNGSVSESTEGFRVRRGISFTGRDLTATAPNGTILYDTKGDFFTLRAHTHFYEQGVREVAVVTKTLFAMRNTYEVLSYEPVCPGQAQSSEKGTRAQALYPYARLTEYMATMYDHWSLEKYQCNGSLVEYWDINTRSWFSLFENLEVKQSTAPGQKAAEGQVVGTIDQAYFFAYTPTYDVYIAKNVDHALMAIVATLVDITHLHRSGSKSSSSYDSADIANTFGPAGNAIGAGGAIGRR